MEIIITGAAGNLGQRVVEAMNTDHTVNAVDKTLLECEPDVVAHRLDIVQDMDELEALIDRVRPDVLIHLAALVGGICEQRPDEARRLNTDATIHLAHLAREYKIGRFVFTSSAAVYHQTELAPTSENQNIDPRGVYGKSKYAAERGIGLAALHALQTQFTTLRIFNAYGHGFNKSLVERLRVSSNDNPVGLFGWQHFYRDYVHADDIVSGIRSAAEYQPVRPQHTVINIGSGHPRSNSALIEEMIDLGASPSYERTGGVDAPDYSWADISLAEELLNFHPGAELNLRT